MLKAKATINGKDTLLIGLSHKNIDHLKLGIGEPYIRIEGADVDLPCDIIIFAGQDEETMTRMLAPGINEDTKIRINRNSGS